MNSSGAITKTIKKVFEESFESVIINQQDNKNKSNNNNSLHVSITKYNLSTNMISGVLSYSGVLEDLLYKLKNKSIDLFIISELEVVHDESLNFVYMASFEIPIDTSLFEHANTRVTEIIENYNIT
jgi:hypothetical protein